MYATLLREANAYLRCPANGRQLWNLKHHTAISIYRTGVGAKVLCLG